MKRAFWLCGAATALMLPLAAPAQTPMPPSVQYPGMRNPPPPPVPPPSSSPQYQFPQGGGGQYQFPSARVPPPPAAFQPAQMQPPRGSGNPPIQSPQYPGPNGPDQPPLPEPVQQGLPQGDATPDVIQAAPLAPLQPEQPGGYAPPPAPPRPWLQAATATLQALDKVNAQAAVLSVRVGQTAKFGSLNIKVSGCVARPPDQAPDSAAFVTVDDSHTDQPGFKGWLLRSDPSASMLEHPIYDLRVLNCGS